MKKTVRIVALLLSLALALCFIGCKKTEPSVNENMKTFVFESVDLDGVTTKKEITTNAATVGEALLAAKLIEGEDSAYGLYVKTVNGLTLDYEKDGKYWAFYVNGEYASTGVDSTPVEDGATYTLKAE